VRRLLSRQEKDREIASASGAVKRRGMSTEDDRYVQGGRPMRYLGALAMLGAMLGWAVVLYLIAP